MLKFLAHDTVNDVALIETQFGYYVRYGCQIDPFESLHAAFREFHNCQSHALACHGHEGA